MPESASGHGGRAHFALLYVLPTVMLIVLAVWPLVAGVRTLFIRDVSNTHLEMKWFQAEAMRDGTVPLVDPYRAGGQPHLGNPNTVALYPDNLLYLVAPTLWSLNAHFWLHLLLAPLTLYWLARATGCSREASWAGGVVYAVSGYVLSCLNLYNLVAPAVWAPALAASCLSTVAGVRPARRVWQPATVWALLILGGDPITAVLALGIAGVAVVGEHGWAKARWGYLGLGLGLGTLLAAPLIIEFFRILSLSFRGHWGYSAAAATGGSWHPVRLIELFLPLAFGRPDLFFWGHRFHFGFPPLLYSLAPGLVALALGVLGLGGRRRTVRWCVGLIVVGVFIALGRSNPAIDLLLRLPGAGLLRMPVKAWVLMTVAGALLAAQGGERLLRQESGVRLLARTLAAIGCGYLMLWLALVAGGRAQEDLLASWMPAGLPVASLAAAERLRWTGLALLSLLLAAAAWLVVKVGRRQRRQLLAVLVLVHAAAQLLFLRPLYESDEIAPFREPSPVASIVPPAARVVHGAAGDLFQKQPIPLRRYPDSSSRWLHRQMFREFYPAGGMMTGRSFDFNLSPEGLDSFLTRALKQAIEQLPDVTRVRLLAASGVEWLLLKRHLAPEVLAAEGVELVAEIESIDQDVRVYRLLRRAAAAEFVGTIHSSETVNDAVARLASASFDPRIEAVIAGHVNAGDGLGGTVRTVVESPERLVWEVDAAGSGALVIQRSHLPLYRARVDGRSVPVYVANVHRMAVLLGPGRHSVELWVDRTPFRVGLGLALASALSLIVLFRRAGSGADGAT